MRPITEPMKKSLMLTLFVVLNAVFAFAQDGGGNGNGGSSEITVSKSTTTTSTSTTDWYTAPWVWIVGGAVFILLLVALIRGGSRNGAKTDITRTTVTRKDVTSTE